MVCWQAAPALPAWLARALDGYLTGETRTVPVAWTIRGTPFQLRVWEALRAIPYGMVWTYGAVAERIGSPRAARAVGQAVAENPLALVVPCHRVVGARGVLGGYRGGTALKRRLLALEGVHGWR
ncbi:MAG: methylated-DNA--[protein]-cysteine S-methyltransferase [Firmicutes bacterium]|nr:methylated-DNA--[protein]-cysteine S-methyltransferase [Alicyclobacillaceae bacterium]MCL6496308.1 methylated-DNA--[protein]-cysteine S-methyltransferase [Bacillota bacterium]